jgi:hypothetical protein
MRTEVLIFVVLMLLSLLTWLWQHARKMQRAEFIRKFMFPSGLADKLRQKRPGLEAKQFQLVARALRQFFLAYLGGGCKPVSMPSRVADDLWHEFILYTRQYDAFCKTAFGRFFHHVPATGSGANDDDELERVWRHACLEENINPRKPTRLPLLFALDAKLGVEDALSHSAETLGQRARERAAKRNSGRSGSGGSGCHGGCGGGCGGD